MERSLFDDVEDSWHWIGEGRRHVVFGYHGSDGKVRGWSLRFAKVRVDEAECSVDAWIRCGWDPYGESWFGRLWKTEGSVQVDVEHDVRDRFESMWKRCNGDRDGKDPLAEERLQVFAWLDRNWLCPWGLDTDLDEPCWCVELKPKCGISPPILADGQAKCRVRDALPRVPTQDDVERISNMYRMANRVQMKRWESTGIVGDDVGYNPCDLFSGELSNQHSAIRGLWQCRSKLLRIYRNGKRIFPGEESVETIEKILTLVLRILGEHGILTRILRLQALSTRADIERIGLIVDSLRPTETSDQWEDVLDPTNWTTPRLCLRRFLLARTADDCSIMIPFRRCHPPSPDRQPSYSSEAHFLTVSQTTYEYTVAIVDVDPLKSYQAIPTYLDQEHRAIRTLWEQHRRTSSSTSSSPSCCFQGP